jgi:DNA-binding response OmpR family regulator
MQFRVVLALADPDTAEFRRTHLRDAGFDVIAVHPSAATAAVRAHRPDIVVTDAPEGELRVSCDDLKEASVGRAAVPVVALTTMDSATAVPAGCDAVLPAHCLPEELVGTLDRLLLSHRNQ